MRAAALGQDDLGFGLQIPCHRKRGWELEAEKVTRGWKKGA